MKCKNYLQSKLYYNWFIVLVLENYITLLVSIYLSYKCGLSNNRDYNGEILSVYVTIVSTILLILVSVVAFVFPFLKYETI